MENEKKCKSEFCKLNALRTKALESNDIEVVKEALKKFSDLWLNVSEDLNYHMCILDGSWTSAPEQLRRGLAKARKLDGRCIICGGERDSKDETQICYVCRKIVAKVEKVEQNG